VRDGFQNKAKIVRPSTPPAGGSPLIIYAFGGGFISGDAESGTPLARAFARLFGAVTVCISYRLAPEDPFPVPMNDAIDNAKWIAAHAKELHADPSKGFISSGTSAGGLQAANMTLASISEKFAYPVTGQWLSVPALMDEATAPEKYKKYYLSREHNTEAPILATGDIDKIDVFLKSDPKSALRFPPLNKDVQLSQVPPTYVQVCGMDPVSPSFPI
jgi:acetyl esterase/lipase